MNHINHINHLGVVAVLVLAGCAVVEPNVVGDNNQVEIRQIQTRHYDTLDKKMTLRSVVATLQDLGFVIDEADLDLGTVSAERHWGQPMRITVTVRDQQAKKTSVRANAHAGKRTVDDPQTYQDFFIALDKAMFLTLNQVD